MSSSSSEILKLNVGGAEHFVTTRTTLCAVKGSMLASMFGPDSEFAPPKEIDGEIFLDRNPAAFPYVLDYLRDGCRLVVDPPKEILPRLRADADYFGLVRLVKCCDQLLSKSQPKKTPATSNPPRPVFFLKTDNVESVPSNDWKLVQVVPAVVANGKVRTRTEFVFEARYLK